MERVKGAKMGTERDFSSSGGCTMRCAHDVLLSRTLETCMGLQTSIASIYSIKKKV